MAATPGTSTSGLVRPQGRNAGAEGRHGEGSVRFAGHGSVESPHIDRSRQEVPAKGLQENVTVPDTGPASLQRCFGGCCS